MWNDKMLNIFSINFYIKDIYLLSPNDITVIVGIFW